MMPIASATVEKRFVRRTSLQPNEYRTNFRQLDCDVIASLISDEACKVTPHMSRIYLALVSAPTGFWEREGVLRLIGCENGEVWMTAWEQLVEHVGVASATARKALGWMSEQGIIGYHAGKNGVGIRIFINRAASSIRQKPEQGQKNLRLVPTSSDAPRTSTDEVPFKESFAILENSDADLIPRAPENGATDETGSEEISATSSAPTVTPPPDQKRATREGAQSHTANAFSSHAIVEQIVREMVPQVKAAATREQERTREWFINHALPKAIRVAQASAYDVLRAHGVIEGSRTRGVVGGGRKHSDNRQVGKHTPAETAPRLLADIEISELAESCVALLTIQGQTIDRSLSGMSVDAGGFLLPEDAPKVRAKAESLIRAGAATQTDRRSEDGC